MQKLVAVSTILLDTKIYEIGEALPANNQAMVDAWVEAGTAVWKDTDEETTKVKAKARSAEPGLSGKAVVSESEDGEDLVGKVPKTAARKKK